MSTAAPTSAPWSSIERDPDWVLAELRCRFPGTPLWYGEFTGRYWAFVFDHYDRPQLLEAGAPELLSYYLHAMQRSLAPARSNNPPPRSSAVPRPVPVRRKNRRQPGRLARLLRSLTYRPCPSDRWPSSQVPEPPMPKLPSLVSNICLPGVPESVPVARRWFKSLLGPGHPALDDVELAGCELITNALIHTDSGRGGYVALILDADEHRIRTYVTDDGGTDTRPHANDAADLECSGRGIHLVEALTDDWGTELVEGECRTTWFEIRLNGR
ncbi:ATP-binding protein [Spirillospora sp. NPDC127200]